MLFSRKLLEHTCISYPSLRFLHPHVTEVAFIISWKLKTVFYQDYISLGFFLSFKYVGINIVKIHFLFNHHP